MYTCADEGLFVSVSTAVDLERALQRHGDDLYRLALLLAPDTSEAAGTLIAAVRRLAAAGAAPDEQALLAALRDALPPERRGWRRRHLPTWASPPRRRASAARLLAAIARLPRQQRLALGLTLLRGDDPTEAAASVGGDETALRQQVRDALLALASVDGGRSTADGRQPTGASLSPIGQPAIDLLGAQAPEACRPTRAALALGGPALHADPAVRGHLALCSECRAAEQTWSRLTSAVEDALRGALREARLPDELAEQLRAAATAQPAAVSGWRSSRGLRIALVALPVLALIAVLVAPRGGRNAAPSGGFVPLPPQPDTRELVRRASEYLYAPPSGSGVWHARYAIQWVFVGGTYALLAADEWIEPTSGRHRLQLIHHDGGGPYEYELGDGVRTAWYAISDTYAPSLYPLSVDRPAPRARLDAMPEQQQQMLRARLQSGAWGLPAVYLRQAQAAELHTWGRQRNPDGTVVSLVSFSGVSPLAPPSDAPNTSISQITVLLALDEASGRLREVRELIGPEGGEQTTRTTWRVESEEWIGESAASESPFDPQRAWTGVGTFVGRGWLAEPALPLAQRDKVVSLAMAVQRPPWTGMWMPARPPPGTTAALLLDQSATPITSGSFRDNERLTFVYLGPGRRLEFGAREPGSTPPLVGGEVLSLRDQQLIMRASVAQSYQAKLTHTDPFGGPTLVTWISAFGYTRAELLDVLRTLGPPTIDSYRAQARLFADPRPHDATFDALLGALDPPPGEGTARHTVERVFARQLAARDPQADPYHMPRYQGLPERTVRETWTRGSVVSGTIETAVSTFDAAGALYARTHTSGTGSWIYNAPTSQLDQFGAQVLFDLSVWSGHWQPTVLNMLACGSAELVSAADNTRTLSLIDTSWQTESCQHPNYPELFTTQTIGDSLGGDDQAPYLADIPDQAVTTWVDLDAHGRLLRAEVRAGVARDGALIQSWELAQDELLPADRAPAAAFNPTPPEAFLRWRNVDSPSSRPPSPHTVTLTEALGLARTPLFGMPVEGSASDMLTGTATLSATLASIEAGSPPPEAAPRSFTDEETPFQSALRYGYALRLTYTVRAPEGMPILYLYEGPAKEFGAYLRGTARWASSAPATLDIGGRKIAGWQVTGARKNAWTLFEIDGTLIAVEYPFDRAAAALATLRRIAGP
jgi:hypothetical protein